MRSTFALSIHIFYPQLHPYWKNTDNPSSTDNVDNQETEKMTKPTPAAILGLGWSWQACTTPTSLEREVTLYLEDGEEGSGMLSFWQVCCSQFRCLGFSILKYFGNRKIDFVILPYFVGQWILFPSLAWLYHVKGFFPQQKKLCPLITIVSNSILWRHFNSWSSRPSTIVAHWISPPESLGMRKKLD